MLTMIAMGTGKTRAMNNGDNLWISKLGTLSLSIKKKKTPIHKEGKLEGKLEQLFHY